MRREHFTGQASQTLPALKRDHPDCLVQSLGTAGRFLSADADLGLVENARKCKLRLDASLDQFWSYDHGEVL